jgi:hypothetical protein
MPKMTLKDRFIVALEAEGCVRTPDQPSRKYVRLTRPNDPRYYYVGISGALRTGLTSTGSIPVSEVRKNRLLATVKS